MGEVVSEATEHSHLTALDPPRATPPRRWQCRACGCTGLLDAVYATQCAPGASDERKRAEMLWALLDDIDTLDDFCRSSDVDFRRCVRKVLKKRHAILESKDGQVLTVPADKTVSES